MSLEIHRTSPQRPPGPDRDKPAVDRAEHANLERAHARTHPRACQAPATGAGWARHRTGPAGWR